MPRPRPLLPTPRSPRPRRRPAAIRSRRHAPSSPKTPDKHTSIHCSTAPIRCCAGGRTEAARRSGSPSSRAGPRTTIPGWPTSSARPSAGGNRPASATGTRGRPTPRRPTSPSAGGRPSASGTRPDRPTCPGTGRATSSTRPWSSRRGLGRIRCSPTRPCSTPPFTRWDTRWGCRTPRTARTSCSQPPAPGS